MLDPLMRWGPPSILWVGGYETVFQSHCYPIHETWILAVPGREVVCMSPVVEHAALQRSIERHPRAILLDSPWFSFFICGLLKQGGP